MQALEREVFLKRKDFVKTMVGYCFDVIELVVKSAILGYIFHWGWNLLK